MERSRAGSLAGVPAHLYRQALADAAGWVRAMVRGRTHDAFGHELRLRFFAGFARTRVADARGGVSGIPSELAHLARTLAGRVGRARSHAGAAR
jgi:hypothetical protein